MKMHPGPEGMKVSGNKKGIQSLGIIRINNLTKEFFEFLAKVF